MSRPNTESAELASGEQALARLIERLTDRAQAGQVLDMEALVREHPKHADELRQLLPALQGLAGAERRGGLARPGR